MTITDAPNSRGGAWSEDGTIVFAENRSGLFRVPSSGGAREPLTTLATGEVTHRFPQFLPGGRAVLYTAHTASDNFDDATIVVRPLSGGTPTTVQRGGYYGRYLPSGHVAYIHKGTLFAAPFDLDRLEVTGPSVPVIENVTATASRGEAQFAFSSSGTLVYLASRSDSGLPLLWFDRQGRTETLRSTPARFRAHRIAPDGQRIALDLFDGTQSDVWIYDFARDTLSRVTFDPRRHLIPTPSGLLTAAGLCLPPTVMRGGRHRLCIGSALMGRERLSVFWKPRASPPRFRGTRVAASFCIRKALVSSALADSLRETPT